MLLEEFKQLKPFYLSRANEIADLKFAQEQTGFVGVLSYPPHLVELVKQTEYGYCPSYRYFLLRPDEDEKWIKEEEEKREEKKRNHWRRKVKDEDGD